MTDMKLYFENVTTEDQYWAFRATKMMFHIFPNAPVSWQEHLIAEQQWRAAHETTSE